MFVIFMLDVAINFALEGSDRRASFHSGVGPVQGDPPNIASLPCPGVAGRSHFIVRSRWLDPDRSAATSIDDADTKNSKGYGATLPAIHATSWLNAAINVSIPHPATQVAEVAI